MHAGLGGIQWVVDAYTLALATVVLSAGALADRLGRRRLFSVGLVLFTVASLACALAGSIGVLEASRALQGVGAAIMFAVSLAILANAFTGAEERAGALAFYGATIGASFAVGPLVGGALTSGFGWRSIFLVNIPVGLLCAAHHLHAASPSRATRRRARSTGPGRPCSPAACSCSCSRCCAATTSAGRARRSSPSSPARACCCSPSWPSRRACAQPMLPLELLPQPRPSRRRRSARSRSPHRWFAVFLYTTLYLQNVRGLSPVEAGLVYMPGTVIAFFVSAASAQMIERGISIRAMISGGLALVAAGMASLMVVGTGSSWLVFLPGEILAMIGTGMFNPAVSNLALSSLPESQSGLAAGVNDTFRQAGIAVGIAALGALIPAQAALGHGDAGAMVDGLHHALLAGAGIAAAGALLTAHLMRTRRREVAPAAQPATA